VPRFFILAAALVAAIGLGAAFLVLAVTRSSAEVKVEPRHLVSPREPAPPETTAAVASPGPAAKAEPAGPGSPPPTTDEPRAEPVAAEVSAGAAETAPAPAPQATERAEGEGGAEADR